MELINKVFPEGEVTGEDDEKATKEIRKKFKEATVRRIINYDREEKKEVSETVIGQTREDIFCDRHKRQEIAEDKEKTEFDMLIV